MGCSFDLLSFIYFYQLFKASEVVHMKHHCLVGHLYEGWLKSSEPNYERCTVHTNRFPVLSTLISMLTGCI